MDISFGMGSLLPATEKLYGLFCGHVQIDHRIGLRQTQLSIFKIKKPVKKGGLLGLGQLSSLMDGVGGGVSVRKHQPSGHIAFPPDFFPGSIAVNSIEGRGRIRVYIRGMGTKLAPQVHFEKGG